MNLLATALDIRQKYIYTVPIFLGALKPQISHLYTQNTLGNTTGETNVIALQYAVSGHIQ